MPEELNIITTDANSVNVNTEDRTITITNDSDATTITLSAAETTTVQIATIGPKGDKGDVGNIDTATLATTGSNTFIGNQTVSGSLFVSKSVTATAFTGSLSGSVFGYVPNEATTSFVTNSQTSSFVVNTQTGSFVTNLQTGSFVSNSQTSSMVVATASYYAETDPIYNAEKGKYITSGSSNTTQTISGSLIIDQNLIVLGSQSVQYITSSQLNIQTNIITVNTATPAVRFGGLAVYDSGSTGNGLTGSILWDSQNNTWIYSNPSGSTYDGAVFLVGPRNSSGIGNEQPITKGYVAIGDGSHHMTSSQIYNSESIIRLETNTQITGGLIVSNGITGSFSGSVFGYVQNIATSSFVTNNQTGSFVTNSQTSSFIVSSQTSSFVTNSQTSSFIVTSQTGSFVQNSQTSSFVTNSQTGSFLLNTQTGSMLSSYTLNSQTSSFIVSSQTSSFLLNTQTGSMLSSYTLNSQTSSFTRNTQTASFAITGSNTFRGNQIISGTITQAVSTASFGGKVGIGITNPNYSLDVYGSSQIDTNPFQIGDSISQYLKVVYVYTGSELQYDGSLQQVLTCITASIPPKLSWASSSNNPNLYIGTFDGIGYAQYNYGLIQNNYSAPAANTQFMNGFNNYLVGANIGYSNNWYIPTKAELQKIYDNRIVLGVTETGVVWSSTEVSGSGTTAWALNFNTGQWVSQNKLIQNGVIPIYYYTISHLPTNLKIDRSGFYVKNLNGGGGSYSLYWDINTGNIKYGNIPSLTLSAASVDHINTPIDADEYIRPDRLEESKFATINIFNHINFT